MIIPGHPARTEFVGEVARTPSARWGRCVKHPLRERLTPGSGAQCPHGRRLRMKRESYPSSGSELARGLPGPGRLFRLHAKDTRQ